MVLILWNFSILSSKSPWTLKRRHMYSEKMATLLVKTMAVLSQCRQTPFQLTRVVSDPRSCTDLRPGAPMTFHNPSLHSAVNLSSFVQWLCLGFWKSKGGCPLIFMAQFSVHWQVAATLDKLKTKLITCFHCVFLYLFGFAHRFLIYI